MGRYEDLQKGRRTTRQVNDDIDNEPSTFMKVINIMGAFVVSVMFVAVGIALIQSPIPEVKDNKPITIDISKQKWKPEQINNLLIVNDAATFVKHPNPKRMGAHLIAESSGNVVLDGDKMNGAFKKSYGIMQVKLGTVYYVRNKRPDLIKLYAPEVNALPEEDILDMLRKSAYFNAKIASLTHIVLIEVCGDQNRASVAYNRGVCTPDEQGKIYLDKILKHQDKI